MDTGHIIKDDGEKEELMATVVDFLCSNMDSGRTMVTVTPTPMQ
jgi:hypothetical protein